MDDFRKLFPFRKLTHSCKHHPLPAGRRAGTINMDIPNILLLCYFYYIFWRIEARPTLFVTVKSIPVQIYIFGANC